METVGQLVEKADMTPILWPGPGTFTLSASIWESLIGMTRLVDAGAFIFREDDRIRAQKQQRWATRDNVILEFGLFCGALGAGNCAVFIKGNPWIPVDLMGVTFVRLDDLERAQLEVVAWAREMRAKSKLPISLTLEQIGAVAHAMTNAGITMNHVYPLMRKLNVNDAATNDAMAHYRPKH